MILSNYLEILTGPGEGEHFTAESFLQFLRRSNTCWCDGDDSFVPWVFRGHVDANWGLVPSAARSIEVNKLKPIIEKFRISASKFDRWDEMSVGFQDEYLFSMAHDIAMRDFLLLGRELKLLPISSVDKVTLLSTVPPLGKPLKPLKAARMVSANDKREHERREMTELAQHYGVPTFLLDWTHDPVTAAVFATTDWKVSAQPTDIAVWAIRTDAEHIFGLASRSRNGKTYVKLRESRPGINKYLDAQSGTFSVSVGAHEDWLTYGKYPAIDEISAVTNKDLIHYINSDSRNSDKNSYLELIERSPCPILRKIILNADHVSALKKLLLRERKTIAHMKPTLDSAAKEALGQHGIYL